MADNNTELSLRALQELEKGGQAWNSFRSSFEGALNLSYAGLGSRDLSGFDLSDIDLSHADLRNTNLKNAKLINVNLTEANLIGADLSNAEIMNAKVVRADLRFATVAGANLRGSDLEKADLSLANLSHADLRDTNLLGAMLVRANLENANLLFSNLRGCDLRAANLEGALLRDETDGKVTVQLEGVLYSKLTRWPEQWNPDGTGVILTEDLSSSSDSLFSFQFDPDFTFVFEGKLSPEQANSLINALADYYRACGGLGLRIKFESAIRKARASSV